MKVEAVRKDRMLGGRSRRGRTSYTATVINTSKLEMPESGCSNATVFFPGLMDKLAQADLGPSSRSDCFPGIGLIFLHRLYKRSVLTRRQIIRGPTSSNRTHFHQDVCHRIRPVYPQTRSTAVATSNEKTIHVPSPST
ncbi:hypothetical protein FGIG_09669 [Fasciola gigantica]|uniref:Uncharacterized protein n=1 Tax=Fasciola gigantica TaxID=46835 RepID=A0A504YCU6_FASGI|nr:hypothetical protein FGIG_09669 [Fasciola gigantica]